MSQDNRCQSCRQQMRSGIEPGPPTGFSGDTALFCEHTYPARINDDIKKENARLWELAEELSEAAVTGIDSLSDFAQDKISRVLDKFDAFKKEISRDGKERRR